MVRDAFCLLPLRIISLQRLDGVRESASRHLISSGFYCPSLFNLIRISHHGVGAVTAQLGPMPSRAAGRHRLASPAGHGITVNFERGNMLKLQLKIARVSPVRVYAFVRQICRLTTVPTHSSLFLHSSLFHSHLSLPLYN